jgi:L-arabinose isomerase
MLLRARHNICNTARTSSASNTSIDRQTTVSTFVKGLKWNDMYYHLANGI